MAPHFRHNQPRLIIIYRTILGWMEAVAAMPFSGTCPRHMPLKEVGCHVAAHPVAAPPAELVCIGLHVRREEPMEGPFDAGPEAGDGPVDHGKRGVPAVPAERPLHETCEGGEPRSRPGPCICTDLRCVAEMAVAELAPGIPAAALHAAHDARPLPCGRPVRGGDERLPRGASACPAFRPGAYAEIVDLHGLSCEGTGRTPIWPWRT